MPAGIYELKKYKKTSRGGIMMIITNKQMTWVLIGFMILGFFCGLFIGSCRAEEATFVIPESTTITFFGDGIYTIDAEGFRSLTPDEAAKVAAAINLFGAGGWYGEDLSSAIVEAFIPERFKEISTQ